MSDVDEGCAAVGRGASTAIRTSEKSRYRPGCLWLLAGAIGIVALVASSLGIALFISEVVTGLAVQRALYYKGDVHIDSEIARPLIGSEQTFDLAVTVWLRAEEYEDDIDDEEMSEHPRFSPISPAIPLYSDIIFRGLRLRDKNAFATVNFTVPTAYFRKSDLTNYDLRGSVVLLPTSPSQIDKIIDYSTSIPRFIETFPVRSWPFPLNSSRVGKKTLSDKALESFGASLPLLEFHNIRKRCEKSEYDFYEEDDESISSTTEFKSPLTHHPYIVTRTQIRIVDETALFDRRAYLEKHRILKQISCKQQAILFPSIHDCDRSYANAGHVETAITLKRADKKGINDVVYSPYISFSKSVGPKDLLPIPVHRQICSTTEDTIQATADDRETVDVSWKLSFSGWSFPKLAFLEEMEKLDRQTRFDMETSDHHLALAHDKVELTDGFYGYKHRQDSHPRRRSLLLFLQLVLSILLVCSDSFYWFTRTTSVGISTLGTLLFAGSKFITIVVPDFVTASLHNEGVFEWLGTLFSITISLFPVVFMVKTVFHLTSSRLERSLWSRWVPHRMSLTHAERASQRIEDQMSLWFKGSIIIGVFVIYYAFSPHSYPVIPAILPAALSDDYYHSWLIDSWPYFASPMDITGIFFQILLTWQSKSYAGSYKVTPLLSLGLILTRFVEYIPGVVGPYDARPRLVAHEFAELVLTSIRLWQSLTHPHI
ncbi:hypothetical protein H2248_001887 [Termitomyces sp. 'cryptogamus']|nr:hypothetical protein H2248_001887 [Termitomyces sp. 'cryptogamus']